MRAALSAIAQWFRDAWNLPWSLKGPLLGLSVAFLALVVTVSVIVATGGGDNTAVSGVVEEPTPTATAEPTSTPALSPTPRPTPTPRLEPPPSAPAAPVPPSALEPGLTAAEVIECEFGQFDGWGDAFNLRPYGFTPFPASLTLTSDPVACEALWHEAYDDGYASGRTDICSTVSDYIEVALPEELEFCGLEPEPLLTEQTVFAFVEDYIRQNSEFLFVCPSPRSAEWNSGEWHVTCTLTLSTDCFLAISRGLQCEVETYTVELNFLVNDGPLFVTIADGKTADCLAGGC